MSGAGRPDATTVDASGLSLAIVGTRWHQEITDSLVSRGVAAAAACGIPDPLVVRVPGAIELSVVAAELARHHDAVACLGAVIRGETAHFDFVAGECAAGLQRVALDTGVPVIFGVLTTDTVAQAQERARPGETNKGYEAAVTALEMVRLLELLPRAPDDGGI